MVSELRKRFVFVGEMFRESKQVGAFSSSSKAVAEALARPIVREGRPLRVLEAGAGTGQISKSIIRRMGPGDRVRLLEINPRMVRVLEEKFASPGGERGPEVIVDQRDIALLPADEHYDVIVSSLPLLNFEPEMVRRVFELFMSRLAPGGTLSYYDYWGKEVRAYIATGSERRRLREVIRVTREFCEAYEVAMRVIPWNFTPARVHYLRRA